MIEDRNNNNPINEISVITLSNNQRIHGSVKLSHCHTDTAHGIDKIARNKLICVSLLCVTFMIGEAVGGLLSKSLAVATDAAHLLTDFAGFMISLLALYVGQRPATKCMSFGWYRAEVIGALCSVLLIWVVTGILVYMAVERLVYGEYRIEAVVMIICAALGVLINIIMGATLHFSGVHGHGHGHGHGHSDGHSDNHDSNGGKSQSNINVRAAFIHVLGDFFQSVGVLVAAIIIYFKPHLSFVDPLCTFVFSIIVLITTSYIIRDALNVIMEGLPQGIDYAEVQRVLCDIPGVTRVHNLRIWSLSMDKTALAAHLAIDKDASPPLVLNMALNSIYEKFKIYESIIQVEEYQDVMNDCAKCQLIV